MAVERLTKIRNHIPLTNTASIHAPFILTRESPPRTVRAISFHCIHIFVFISSLEEYSEYLFLRNSLNTDSKFKTTTNSATGKKAS